MKFTLVFGALVLMTLACGGGETNPPANQQPQAKEEPKKEEVSAIMLEAGETIFKTYCVVCHGADGKSMLNGAKDLTLSVLTKEELVQVVTKGRNAMAAYESILKPDEIDAVTSYVMAFRQQ